MNNDEIIQEENEQMSHYESLTLEERLDREHSLMDKARMDERKIIINIFEKIFNDAQEKMEG